MVDFEYGARPLLMFRNPSMRVVCTLWLSFLFVISIGMSRRTLIEQATYSYNSIAIT